MPPSGTPGRAEKRDRLAAAPAIDTEIFLVHGNHGVPGKWLAHTDEAQISRVGVAVLVSFRYIIEK